MSTLSGWKKKPTLRNLAYQQGRPEVAGGRRASRMTAGSGAAARGALTILKEAHPRRDVCAGTVCGTSSPVKADACGVSRGVRVRVRVEVLKNNSRRTQSKNKRVEA